MCLSFGTAEFLVAICLLIIPMFLIAEFVELLIYDDLMISYTNCKTVKFFFDKY